MAFCIANGMGDSSDEPSPAQMRKFLVDVETTDEEHGAAWLSTDDHVVEWSGGREGLLVFSSTTAERSAAKAASKASAGSRRRARPRSCAPSARRRRRGRGACSVASPTPLAPCASTSA
jgi:hypothetical protein